MSDQQQTDTPAAANHTETWRAVGLAVAAAAALLAIVTVTVLVLATPWARGKDFLATSELAQLKSQFAQNPKNKPLAENIRRLDLDLRHQYFSHLTLARHGNWLLLGCLVVFVAAIKAALELRPVRPRPGAKQPDFQNELQRVRGRRWAVAAVGPCLSRARLRRLASRRTSA